MVTGWLLYKGNFFGAALEISYQRMLGFQCSDNRQTEIEVPYNTGFTSEVTLGHRGACA